jgi:hypothetical protein
MSGGWQAKGEFATGLVSVTAGIALLAGDAGAAQRADLALKKLSVAPTTVTAGDAIKVAEKTANLGARTAPKSKTSFYLSTDFKRSGADARLGDRKVEKLKPKKKSSAKTQLTLPASTPPGTYVLIACADSGGAVKERGETNNCRASGGLAVSSGGGFPRPANPLSVSATLESGAAATALMPAAGGALAATSSNGTQYKLTLPANALFSDTQVTMTPVSGLSGAPLSGGLVGAVKLEPEGLTLNKPAILTITPPAPAPAIPSQTGFLAEGDGGDFHQYPLAFGTTLRLELMHFTIGGAGSGTDADRQQMADHTPVTSQAQWEAAVAERLRQARESDQAGTPDNDWPNDLKPVHIAYYRGVVRPAMVAALDSDGAFDDGIREGLGWLQKINHFGFADDPEYAPLIGEVYDTLHRILQNALNRAYSSCVNQHDLRSIQRIAQVARTAALIGFDLGPGLDLVANCLRFEVDLGSRVTLGGWTYRTQAVDIQLEPVILDRQLVSVGARGEGQLHWLEFSGHAEYDYECPRGATPPSMNHGTLDAAGASDTTAIASLLFDLSPPQQGAPAADDTFGAQIAFNTNQPKEFTQQVESGPCAQNALYENYNWENFWASSVIVNDPPEYEVVKTGTEGSPSTQFTTFTEVLRGGPDGQLLRVAINDGFTGLTEQLTIDVRHRPRR